MIPATAIPRTIRLTALLAAVIAPVIQAGAIEMVREGKPVGTIVIPAQPLDVEAYAAKELQYHIEMSTGARLPIVGENISVSTGTRMCLGRNQGDETNSEKFAR